jgi:hypothetical protein
MKRNTFDTNMKAVGPWLMCGMLAACGTVEEDEAASGDDAGETVDTAENGGADAGAGDDTGGGSGDVENVRQRILDALCAANTACCGAAPDPTPPECGSPSPEQTARDEAFDQAVADGRIGIDADAFGACLELLTGDACSATARFYTDPTNPCAGVASGQVAAGQPCTFSDECAAGVCGRLAESDAQTVCLSAAVDAPCPLLCIELPDGSRACEGECGPGLECEDGTCAANGPALPAVGEPCTTRCAVRAWCAPDGVCAAAKPEGEPCESELECLSFECDGGACTAYSLCE